MIGAVVQTAFDLAFDGLYFFHGRICSFRVFLMDSFCGSPAKYELK